MTVSTRTFPPPFRLLNAFGKITHAKRLPRFRLEENPVLREATRRTGLTDFGNPEFQGGLRALLASAEQDASLHFLGHISLRRSVVESLINRLLLVEAQKRTPEWFYAPLVPPLIVLGLPRSGTTYLHRLLAEDPAHHAPPFWELVRPLPQPGERDDRREVIARELVWRKRVAPELDRKHFITPDTPEECLFMLGATLEALLFWVLAPVQGYMEWYVAQDHTRKYQEYRAWLQVLQAATPDKRLVMKAPEHTGALAALLYAVPEAHIIQTHRDPASAYASFNSLITTTHATSSVQPDIKQMAEMNLRLLEIEIMGNLAAREANPDVVHDVWYDELVADPTGTVRRIYERFGLDSSDAYQTCLATYVQEHPRAKHGSHRYSLEDYGMSDSHVRDRLTAYCERFDL
jgi:hypothetical protein